MVITQHMPATFTPILAEHMTKLGGLPCAEARDGELLTGRPDPSGAGQPPPAGRGHGQRRCGLRLRTRRRRTSAALRVDPMLRSAAARLRRSGAGGDADRHGPRRAATARARWSRPAAPRWPRTRRPAWSGACPAPSRQAGLCHRVLPLPALAPAVLELLQSGLRPAPVARASQEPRA